MNSTKVRRCSASRLAVLWLWPPAYTLGFVDSGGRSSIKRHHSKGWKLWTSDVFGQPRIASSRMSTTVTSKPNAATLGSEQRCSTHHDAVSGVSSPSGKDVPNKNENRVLNAQDKKQMWTKDEINHRQRKLTKTLKAMANRREWREVTSLLAEAHTSGIPLTVICCNAAMGVFARSGCWSQALELLSNMQDKGTEGAPLPIPDVITYNTAISACGRGRKYQLALNLLRQMEEEGISPDRFSFSAAISACKSSAQWQTALTLLDTMQRKGLGRELHSLNAAVAACAVACQWEPALSILQEMEKKGPRPDVFTFSSAIDACGRGGQPDKAVALLRVMSRSRIAPNIVCYNATIGALARYGRWQEARALLREIQTRPNVGVDVKNGARR
ncbi:unnamed protein product, partial [Choristocarpus tenellus]